MSNFHIVCEFFGRIGKDQLDNNIGSTLEKATFSVIQENKTNQFILCVGNKKGGFPSLLFISKKCCYIFDPHSRNSWGLPIDGGTSILASFKSRQNIISHIRFMNSLSQCSRQNTMDSYSMYIVSFNQVNIQIQSYFVDQKYQFLKSKQLTKEQKTLKDGKVKSRTQKVYTNKTLQNEKNIQKQKSAAEKRRSENEICETSKRKKYDFEYNSKSCESEKQQDKKTNYKRPINNIKCLHK